MDELDPRMHLPVWIQEPNWENGMVERLEWQTWVGESEAKVEQRVAQRRFPRRTFEANFRAADNRRSTVANMLVTAGRREWLVPLWMYKARTTAAIEAGEREIRGDFRLRQFVEGELLILRGEDYFTREVAVIELVEPTRILVTTPLEQEWPERTLVQPLRVCVMTATPSVNNRTSRVSDVTVRFQQRTPERQTIDISDIPLHPLDGLPFLALEHNWREEPTTQFIREAFEIDNQQGVPHYFDVGAQTTYTDPWRVMTQGRVGLNWLRSLAYYFRGQQNLVWVPTHTDDFQVVAQVIPWQGELVVRRTGYEQFGVAGQDVRRDIAIWMADGQVIINRIVSGRVDGDTERLVLADTLDQPYRPEDFRRISYISHARLANDTLEIQHQTDADGVQEAVFTFFSFQNRRRAS